MTKGGLDVSLVRRHLLALDRAVTVLRRHAGRPVETLEKDVDAAWTVERGLQLCAQNCLDIATHLSAAAGRDVADYASALDTLGDLGVVEPGFVARFRGLAGFRNVLVHAYLEVDLRIVHKLLNERLDDFGVFAENVSAYVDRAE